MAITRVQGYIEEDKARGSGWCVRLVVTTGFGKLRVGCKCVRRGLLSRYSTKVMCANVAIEEE